MVEDEAVERKLAVIFAADIAGYSRLMGLDELGTLRRLRARRAILDGLIARHHGRIFNTAGDSVVADFASPVDAVECAVAVQDAIAAENVRHPGEPMLFRIGVHLGDVIVDGSNLLGDGVNIAARLQGLAEPGGICLSGAVRDQVGTRLPVSFVPLGEQRVKNIAEPVRVFQVDPAGDKLVGGARQRGRKVGRRLIAAAGVLSLIAAIVAGWLLWPWEEDNPRREPFASAIGTTPSAPRRGSRSSYCRLPITAPTPSRNISPTASPRI